MRSKFIIKKVSEYTFMNGYSDIHLKFILCKDMYITYTHKINKTIFFSVMLM